MEDDYRKELGKALELFLEIEDVLRSCLTLRIELDGSKYNEKKLDRQTLGGLVNLYKTISNDQDFNESLEIIKKDRNDVVHRTRLSTLGELNDDKLRTGAMQWIRDIQARGKKVHADILDVSYALRRATRTMKRPHEENKRDGHV